MRLKMILCAHQQTTCMVKYNTSKNRSFKISSRATSNTNNTIQIYYTIQSINTEKPKKVLVLPLFHPDSLSSRQHFPELGN